MSAYELNKTILKDNANLKAYYRFESGALTTDSSGNSKTLTNNNTVGEGTGVYGGSADFSASNTNKSFSIADALAIDGGACSFSFWVKNSAEISTGNYRYLYQRNNTSKVEYFLDYQYNGGTRKLTFGRNKVSVAIQEAPYTVTMGTSSWFHIVGTYDGTTIRLYVNGSHVGSGAASGNGSGVTGTDLTIGTTSSCIMDDFAVFGVALSADQIKELYEGRYIGEWMPQSGLVGLWHLNGNSTDVSGNNNHGTDTAITYSLANGKIAQGAGFNGSSSFISLGTGSAMNPTSAITIMFWAYSTNTASTGRLVSRDDTGVNRVYDISYGGTSGTAARIYFLMNGLNAMQSSTDLANNVYYLVACTFDGTTQKIYVNGVLDGSSNYSAAINSKTVATLVGKRSDGLFHNGKLDEVAIFSRALTASEIRHWYAWSVGKYL